MFLLWLALPSLRQNTANFLTSRNWIVAGNELSFGIAGLLWTTVLTAVMAMVLAVPVAVGVALFLTQYVHKRVSGPLSFVVDLLAAVPSIIFGLWGLTVLGPFISPAGDWLIANLGFIPLFAPGVTVKSSVFVAGVVLAIMILPIVTAISRDVFAQTPRDHVEAAYALGATRWEMIRTAVLPVRSLRRDQCLDARPRPGSRRDHRRHDHPDHAGSRSRTSARRSSPAGRPSPARSPTTPPSSTARPRPGPTSPPAWCCSWSPSW